MSERKHQNISKKRMDRFLYYSKFGLLIIVALLFMIAYSFYQQELPTTKAELYINPAGEYNTAKTNILIVIDFDTYYQAKDSHYIYLLNNIINNIKDSDYDLVLLDESAQSSTILDNIDAGLLLRIYNEKQYDYIIAVGNNAIMPAKEMQELFMPAAKIFIYDADNASIYNALHPINESEYVSNVLELAFEINPDTEKILFMHNELIPSQYSDSIFNIANEYTENTDGLSYEVIYTDHSNITEVIKKINNQTKETLLFYLSSDLADENSEAKNASIIYKLQIHTDKLIYDLSPLNQKDVSRLSIRYYPTESIDTPIAHIAIKPENVCEYNYEFVDFAVANAHNTNTSFPISDCCITAPAFISWCMDNIGLSNFPDAVEEQYDYCKENSLFIDFNDIQPGDLLFYSNSADSPDDICGVAIYINDDTMISQNRNGVIGFNKIKSEKFIISFAHPYSLLKKQYD